MNKPTFILVLVVFQLIVSCSKEEAVEVDTISPTIELSITGFTSSTPGQTVVISNQFEIVVNAQDAGGVAKIEAFINGTKVGEDSSAPYRIIIDVSSLESKAGLSSKYNDYTLKVTATDTSGNTASTEQVFHVDNELPVISDVSLIENTVIGGDNNLVSFKVTDNQEISAVYVYVNNEVLSLTENEDGYEVTIETSALSDGENTFKIEALDSAENLAEFMVTFIVDNTGPEISLESILENQILDEPVTLVPEVQDLYSSVISLEIFNGDTSLILFENTTEYSLDFDPEIYPTGTNTIILKAKDALNNESILEIPIEIYRRLLTINFPLNFFDSNIVARLYVFASSADGKVLDNQRVFTDTEQFILRTVTDVDQETEFSITFGEYRTGAIGNASEFTTIQNLKRSTLGALNLKASPRFGNQIEPSLFPTEGFDPDDNIGMNAEGFGYGGGYYPDTKELMIDRRRNTTSNINSDFIHIPLFNYTLNEYSYATIDWEMPSDFILTADLFTTEGVERREFQPIFSNGEAFESSLFWIAGYFNQDDFLNNVYHRIYGLGNATIQNQVIPYYFNNTFNNYKYTVQLNNYFTERTGEPLESYTTLDWTIDYTFANKEIHLVKNGIDHTVGKIVFDPEITPVINGMNISYRWSFIFDSQQTDVVIIPEIPEEIQSWGFYQVYEQNSLEIVQVEIKRYDGINSYNEYLTKIIKDNNFSYTISPVMESKFKPRTNNYYFRAPHFLLD